MVFEVIYISRGHIRLKREDEYVRVLGEALIAKISTDPSYVFYLNSLNNWEAPSNDTLTEHEKQDILSAIRQYFDDRRSVVEFD